MVLSCGQAFSCSSPGWFRIVFSDQDTRLQLGMQRIRKALEELKASQSSNDPRESERGIADQITSASKEKEHLNEAKDSVTSEAARPAGSEKPLPEDCAAKLSSATDADAEADTDAVCLDGEELVVLDCQSSQSGEKLDSLIGELRQQIRSSDWLEKNTPELSAGEDPELLEVFKDLLERARK